MKIDCPDRDEARCPVCASTLEGELYRCPRCETPHHKECWDWAGGCAIYGCRPDALVLGAGGEKLDALRGSLETFLTFSRRALYTRLVSAGATFLFCFEFLGSLVVDCLGYGGAVDHWGYLVLLFMPLGIALGLLVASVSMAKRAEGARMAVQEALLTDIDRPLPNGGPLSARLRQASWEGQVLPVIINIAVFAGVVYVGLVAIGFAMGYRQLSPAAPIGALLALALNAAIHSIKERQWTIAITRNRLEATLLLAKRGR